MIKKVRKQLHALGISYDSEESDRTINAEHRPCMLLLILCITCTVHIIGEYAR